MNERALARAAGWRNRNNNERSGSYATKAIVLKNAHELVVEQAPEPQIGPDEALIKVAACGVCGTRLTPV
jgi:NADPH:quinone reductase-like Zn-dependent oxidoreductase